jgi:hypothetical protein
VSNLKLPTIPGYIYTIKLNVVYGYSNDDVSSYIRLFSSGIIPHVDSKNSLDTHNCIILFDSRLREQFIRLLSCWNKGDILPRLIFLYVVMFGFRHTDCDGNSCPDMHLLLSDTSTHPVFLDILLLNTSLFY